MNASISNRKTTIAILSKATITSTTTTTTRTTTTTTTTTTATINPVRCWLPNVPTTCLCISSTDLLRQLCSCYTEIRTEVADQTCYLIQTQYLDTGLTSLSTDPTTPGAWQGNHWSTDIEVTGMIRPGKIPTGNAGFEPRPATLGANTILPGRRGGPSQLTLWTLSTITANRLKTNDNERQSFGKYKTLVCLSPVL